MAKSESWSSLQTFMEQRIHIRIVDRGERDNLATFWFLESALRFGSRAAAEHQVSDWLLRGARYFWTFLPKRCSYSFNLKDFGAPARDLALKILKQLPFSGSIDVKLSLWKSCFAPSLVELLPQRTRRLEVFLHETVGLQFFPQLLSSFDELTYFVCNIPSRTVSDVVKSWSSAQLTDFSIPLVDFGRQNHFFYSNDFLYKRQGGFIWTRVKHAQWAKRRIPIARDITYFIYVRTEEFRKISKKWFRCIFKKLRSKCVVHI